MDGGPHPATKLKVSGKIFIDAHQWPIKWTAEKQCKELFKYIDDCLNAIILPCYIRVNGRIE